MMERREGDGTQWSPLLPSVLPWSSGTPSMTSQVVHFTGTPAMTSPMVHFSGTPTMTSQAVHFTGPPTMSSRVVNFTGTTTMTSQVGNFTGSPTMTSQVGNFTGSPTMTSQVGNFSGSPTIPSQVGNFSGSQTIDCGGPSQLADHLSNYGFVSPTCESLTSANLLPYRPLFSPKRKCPIAWDEIPPPKLHITDEQMACRMKGLQISNAANLLTQQTQQPQKDDVTLVVCDEIRQLRMPDNILPAELLAKLERPSKALVVWKPPEQRAAELLQQTLKAKKKEEEKMEDDKKENANDQKPSGSAVYSFQPNNQTTSSSSVFSFQSNDQNSSSPSVYSFQPNDQRASTSSVYSFQPHPTLPNFSLDALNNNNTLFEAPVQQQPCTSNEDVEDMDV